MKCPSSQGQNKRNALSLICLRKRLEASTHPKDTQILGKTLCYGVDLSYVNEYGLFELNHTEIVLVVDDDTVAVQLAGLAGGLPQ